MAKIFTTRRPCRHPGCSALIPAGQGSWCPAHARASRVDHAARDRLRGSAAERGYDYRWQQARAAFLAKYPLCPGVLIPLPEFADGLRGRTSDKPQAGEHAGTGHRWTRAECIERAQAFHLERELRRERGDLLWLSGFRFQVSGFRFEPWDIGRPAVAVDHIVPHRGDPELLWAEWNWQPLTKRAHDKKTSRYDREGFVTGHRAGGATGTGPGAPGIGETARYDHAPVACSPISSV